MIVNAASGDTWGISGPTFLRYYLAAAIVVVAIVAYHRVRLLAAPAQTTSTHSGHSRSRTSTVVPSSRYTPPWVGCAAAAPSACARTAG